MLLFWTIISAFILLDLAWWTLADRRLKPLRFARPLRIGLACWVGSMIVYLLLTILWAGPVRRSGTLPVFVHTFIYLWHFIVLPIAMIVFAATRLRAGFAKRKRPKLAALIQITAPAVNYAATSSLPIPFTRSAPTRRQILAAAALAVPPLITGMASERSIQQLYGRRTQKYVLRLPQLPRQLDGMTIVHVSDTHIGKFLNPERLPAIADDINKLDGDFITFTGDLIDLALDDLPHGIKFLRSINARNNLVVCEGNHDIMQNRGDFEFEMRNAGLPIILGDHLTLPHVARNGFPVQFLAVPWNPSEEGMADAVKILSPEVRPDAFPILLAHHPHSFDAAAEEKFPLVLSGHTHGGQIMLTSQIGLGRLRFKYTSGLYTKPGSSLIVNNGLGNWFPLRINAPAELVHITLQCT